MLSKDELERFTACLPIRVSEALLEVVRDKAEIITLKRGETLMEETPKEGYTYLILSGSCVRYSLNSKGEERAIFFHTEAFLPVLGGIHIGSENSWVRYCIKANETTELVRFPDAIAMEWREKDAGFSALVYQRNITYLSEINQINNHLLGLSKEDFFRWLMQRHGFIFQRFFSKDIASFMGVTPVWLSHIKRRWLKK